MPKNRNLLWLIIFIIFIIIFSILIVIIFREIVKDISQLINNINWKEFQPPTP